jgi:hypothetical protein
MEIKGNWGGKRPGAGAKRTLPVGARRRALSMTDEECKSVKVLLKKLRGKSKMKLNEIAEAWLDEASEGFIGSELNLNGFETPVAYVKAYADGAMDVVLSDEEANEIISAYNEYAERVKSTGEYSDAKAKMMERLDKEVKND